MGYVNTQITLKNLRDVFNAKKGNLPEDKIRQAAIDVMVDAGASMLVINEQLLFVTCYLLFVICFRHYAFMVRHLLPTTAGAADKPATPDDIGNRHGAWPYHFLFY